ncbi:MAG: GNAT family N-acetyltransferase [Actinomycetota bacterium]|nr:GNAT family N-acetyltransferase [Actinomycetota bacterium]
MNADSVARHAAAAALGAAARAHVEVRILTTLEEFRSCEGLFDRIWRPTDNRPVITRELLKALTGAGGYVSGVFDDDRLGGACVGFWGPPGSGIMHSHITGVDPAARGRDLGLVLKLHQRATALARGATTITWTYDPLVARNAYFNLRKLGAQPTRYLVDYYGSMSDEINADDPTDRLLVAWDLDSPRVLPSTGDAQPSTDKVAPVALLAADADGRPVRSSSIDAVVAIAVPPDVERLRIEKPALAAEWRVAVRHAMTELLDEGARIVDFERSESRYVVRRRDSDED